MIRLERNGKIKLMNQATFDVLKGSLDGWKVVEKTPVKVFEQKKPQATQPESEKKVEPVEITREDMLSYLSAKGIKCHPNIGDEKLKKRYDAEIEIS